jgi:hypothetical protein
MGEFHASTLKKKLDMTNAKAGPPNKPAKTVESSTYS